MLDITEIDKIMFGVDRDLYKRFCVLHKIKGIGIADMDILCEKFKVLRFPFLDHVLFMYTLDGKVLLVTNPYMDDEQCRWYLKDRDLDCNVEIGGVGNSFYEPGKTNIVTIEVGTY